LRTTCVETLAVVRVNELAETVERSHPAVGSEVEHAEQLVGPPMLVGADVPRPATDSRDALRLVEAEARYRALVGGRQRLHLVQHAEREVPAFDIELAQTRVARQAAAVFVVCAQARAGRRRLGSKPESRALEPRANEACDGLSVELGLRVAEAVHHLGIGERDAVLFVEEHCGRGHAVEHGQCRGSRYGACRGLRVDTLSK
jgi:hypothetical protein